MTLAGACARSTISRGSPSCSIRHAAKGRLILSERCHWIDPHRAVRGNEGREQRNDAVEVPIRIASADRARVSGFVFPESLAHVAGSPYVVRDRRGAGSVVLFLDDPNFRLFWDGLTRLFFNALFLSDGVSGVSR
jgi:hypothetical protein